MNIWDQEGWRVIPTNGVLKKDGTAVVGAGLAAQAQKIDSRFEVYLGEHIQRYGNTVAVVPCMRVITFPTKTHWSLMSDLSLIDSSAADLARLCSYMSDKEKVWIPKVGCGLGQRNWEEVKPLLLEHLQEYVDSGLVRFI